MSNIGYIPSLDGVRALSVLIVVIAHSGFGNIVPGGLGVTVFFFLSGYLITTLLVDEYAQSNKINYKYFVVRRFFRLFPPLIITLIVSYGLFFLDLIGGSFSWIELFSQLFYLANYSQVFGWGDGFPDGLGILWSLAVEEHFYLLYPILLPLALKFYKSTGVTMWLVVLCLVVLCWRSVLILLLDADSYRTYYSSDTRIDSIIYGCILAIACNPVLKIDEQQTIRGLDLVGFFVGVGLLLFSLLYRDENFRETFRYSIQGIALLPIFYCCIKYHRLWFFRWLNHPFMRKMGVYSYFIYLIHFVVISFLRHNDIVTNNYLIVVLTLIIAIVYAALIDQYVDPTFRRLRKRFH